MPWPPPGAIPFPIEMDVDAVARWLAGEDGDPEDHRYQAQRMAAAFLAAFLLPPKGEEAEPRCAICGARCSRDCRTESGRPDAERAPQEDRRWSGWRQEWVAPRPQGDEVETVARARERLRSALASREEMRSSLVDLLRILDARSGADTVKLADIRQWCERFRRDTGVYPDWEQIDRLFASGADRPEQPSPDTLGGQPPSEPEDNP